MNTYTGQLIPSERLSTLPPREKKDYIEVKRDLTTLEAAQMQIKLYSPCGCGSGKKLKFCCYKSTTKA